MTATQENIGKREAIARGAIERAFGTKDDEFGTTLFVSHHLEEIESEYWLTHLATAVPEPAQILKMLVLRSHWGGDDDIDTFDFTLPESVTNYVISVQFDEFGQVGDIAMES